jgi:hypothetical protein
MGYYCNKCGQAISSAVFEYSLDHYDRPLCISCQREEDALADRDDPEWLDDEEEGVLDLASEAKKVFRGVSKAVKERSIVGERDFNKWITKWRDVRKLNFSLESRHFFLGGPDLDDFTKNLMNDAQRTILLANPFLEMCYLTDYLTDARARGVDVKVVLRPEENNPKRVECQTKLRKQGISLYRDSRIHSKIIVIDDKVAVVSSMNFYSGSSGGSSNEAGIVSIDEAVVESASNYIKKFLDN